MIGTRNRIRKLFEHLFGLKRVTLKTIPGLEGHAKEKEEKDFFFFFSFPYFLFFFFFSLFFHVADTHGGLIAAHVLKEHGVKTIFTLTGGKTETSFFFCRC